MRTMRMPGTCAARRAIIASLRNGGLGSASTSMVGALMPATAFAMIAQTGDIFSGLWYPIVIAMMTFVIGMLFVPENKDKDIFAADTK